MITLVISCFSPWANILHPSVWLPLFINIWSSWHQTTKGQLNSEWIYEVIVCPKILAKNYRDFCPGSSSEGWAEIFVIFGWDFGTNDGVHVIKATQYTRLKATPKNTGKKATKIYRNIGYNEYTGLKATAFLNTQEKRLHFLNVQEKGLHFWIYIYKSRNISDYSWNQVFRGQ